MALAILVTCANLQVLDSSYHALIWLTAIATIVQHPVSPSLLNVPVIGPGQACSPRPPAGSDVSSGALAQTWQPQPQSRHPFPSFEDLASCVAGYVYDLRSLWLLLLSALKSASSTAALCLANTYNYPRTTPTLGCLPSQ